MSQRRLAKGSFNDSRAPGAYEHPNQSQTSKVNLDEDPLENWTLGKLEQEAADLHQRGGFKYVNLELFQKGAILAQDPVAYRDLDTNFDKDEKLHLERENIPKKASLLSKSRQDQFKQPRALWFLVIFCSLGALVQGWDESVVNGAQLYYQEDLNIPSESILGLINGAPYLCCIISCWLPAVLHPLGRKGAIAVTCVVSFASCLAQGLVRDWQGLLVARLVLGFGIGPKSAIIPIFASECVPETIRGALVMCWQMWTAFGIALGLALSVGLQDVGKNNWRLMLGSPMIIPFALFFITFSQYESPRWLIQKAQVARSDAERKKHYNAAFDSLKALRNTPVQAARDLFRIDMLLQREARWRENRNPWRDLVHIGRSRRAFTASVVTMFFQQFCGVNILAYYSSSVFLRTLGGDFHTSDPRQAPEMNVALWLSFGFGMINFFFSLPAIVMIDYFGRRDLLLGTFPFMALFQLGVGLSFLSPVFIRRGLVPLFAYLFAIFYSIGEGPVPFVYASESLPLYTRDQGMGVITSVNWGLNFLLAMTWPSMQSSAMGETGSFAFYAGMCLIGFFVILLFVPETKKYLLEDLSDVFNKTTPELCSHGAKELKWLIRQFKHPLRKIEWEERPELVQKEHLHDGLTPLETRATGEALG